MASAHAAGSSGTAIPTAIAGKRGEQAVARAHANAPMDKRQCNRRREHAVDGSMTLLRTCAHGRIRGETLASIALLFHTNDRMEDSSSYADRLERVLEAKAGHLDTVELRHLKDEFKLFQSAYQAIINVLLKKGLIHEDPYKFDFKVSDIQTPPETPFAESEKLDQMCIRLSQFESYLDFLNNYYEFSVDFLSMGRIKRLISLTKYFAFTNFTDNSPHMNTRYFSEIVSQVRKGTDPMSTGIVNEGLLQLDKASRKVFQILKGLALLHKERYKLQVRRLAVIPLKLDRDFVVTHGEDSIRKIRQKLGETGADAQFYPDLVGEALKEDYAADGEALRDEILKSLAIAEQKSENKAADRSFKASLLDGIRTLIGVGFQLEDAIRKLEENQALIDSMDKSFLTKVKKALREMFGKSGEHVVHDVEYLDPVSSERKHESIDFTEFCSSGMKRAQSLVAMVSRNSVSYKRLESSTEDVSFKFLSKLIEELQSLHRKLSALNEFFLDTVQSPELKGKIKSVNIELGSVKNAIIKANQKRHEYMSQKDEQEQLKRLGVRET
jgi:hypothetical protein